MRINYSPALATRCSQLLYFSLLFSILMLFLLLITKLIMKPPVIRLFNWPPALSSKVLSLTWLKPLSYTCFGCLVIIFLIGKASFHQELPILLVVIFMLPAFHRKWTFESLVMIVTLLLVLPWISRPISSFSRIRLTAAWSTSPIRFYLLFLT